MGRATGGSVRRLPSGRFQASYRHQGVRVTGPATFASRHLAQRWLRSELRLIDEGTWLPPAERPATGEAASASEERVRVGDWGERWLAELEAAGRSPNTLRTYMSMMRRYIMPTFGEVAVADVTQERIRVWLGGFDPQHPRTRVNAYRVFHSMLQAAAEAGVIEAAPGHIKGATSVPPLSIEQRAARERVATPGQVDEIAARMPPDLAVCVYLAAWCGLRYGEIAGLTRRDIDLSAGLVRVRRAVKRTPRGQLVAGPPKSERSRRDVPIPPRIIEVVEEHLARHTPPDQEGLVVSSRAGTFLSNRTLLHAYRRAVDGMEGLEGLTFHQLRATCASQLMSTGATPVEIMAILGHSDWTTSMLYQRAPRERLRAAMDRLSEDAR